MQRCSDWSRCVAKIIPQTRDEMKDFCFFAVCFQARHYFDLLYGEYKKSFRGWMR